MNRWCLSFWCPKRLELNGGEEQKLTFVLVKEKLCSAHVFALPNFTKAFEIECDAFGIEISVVLWSSLELSHLRQRTLCVGKST